MWRKGKAPSLHKPLAEQEALWTVGVLRKADVANSSQETPNQTIPPSLFSQGVDFCVCNKSTSRTEWKTVSLQIYSVGLYLCTHFIIIATHW